MRATDLCHQRPQLIKKKLYKRTPCILFIFCVIVALEVQEIGLHADAPFLEHHLLAAHQAPQLEVLDVVEKAALVHVQLFSQPVLQDPCGSGSSHTFQHAVWSGSEHQIRLAKW